MFRINHTSSTRGFTLVEVVIIAPIALLVIGGFVSLMVTMVGDIMVSHGRNTLTHDLQASLDLIERDVRLSTEFLDTTGALPSPQGRDGATSAFTSTGGDLILGEIATDKNTIDPTRSFTYYQNAPYACGDSQVYKNRIFFTTVMYFVQNGSLWRRTFVPAPGATLCPPGAWQVNTCAPGYTAAATQCATNDTEVMKNVNTFTVSYYADGTSTTPLAASSAPSAMTIGVAINGRQTVAGRNLNSTASLRSTKLTSKDISLSIPVTPTVTAQAYDASKPNNARFTWSANPLVKFTVRYNINGGAWVTAAENTSDSSVNVTAFRNDTVTVQVAARNSTGLSGFGSGASLTLPTWNDCTFENGWYDYGSPHATCGYTKTTDGIVTVKGMIRTIANPAVAATAQTLFVLPDEYRPRGRLMFQAMTYNATNTDGVPARVDVLTNGQVRVMSGNTGWLSLNDIKFLPDRFLPSKTISEQWINLTLINDWEDFGSGYAPFEAAFDGSDRLHLHGVVKPGPSTNSTLITQLPPAYLDALFGPPSYPEIRPPLHLHLSAYPHNFKRIDLNGDVTVPDFADSYYTMQGMYHPASFTGWMTLNLVNGWTPYGASNSSPRYVRTSDCMVSIRGLINNTSITNGAVVANLPAGYRPSETRIFSGVASGGNTYRLQIEADGEIRAYDASTTYTSLDGIDFVAGDGSPCPT